MNLSDYLYLRAYLGGEQYPVGPASFARPANTTAYAAPTSVTPGDLIGPSTVNAAANPPLRFDVAAIDAADTKTKGKVAYVWLRCTGAPARSIRVHILKGTVAAPPKVSVVDNVPIAFDGVAPGDYLGFGDVTLQPHPLGGVYGATDLVRIPYTLDLTPGSEERLWAYHESLTAFPPLSGETLSCGLYLDRTR